MKTEEFEVRPGERKIKRDKYAALKTIFKVLTELITNSDQQYKDHEKELEDHSKIINIFLDKGTGDVYVVDYGFGLDFDAMEEEFYEYGSQKKSHKEGSRNLFGQGLSDVLFSREQGGELICFKEDDIYSSAFFQIKKEKGEHGKIVSKQKIKLTKDKANSILREQYHIEKNRGTCVHFKYEVKEMPKNKGDFEVFLNKLSNFYMLRKINNNPKRSINLIILDNSRRIYNSRVEYNFMNSGKKLTDIEESFEYKDRNGKIEKIKIKGELWRHEDKLVQGEYEIEERVGGILIFDDFDNVLDLSLFIYDENPYASHFYGEIKLIGANRIIRKELNHQTNPIAILTETRDGFDKKTNFYKLLDHKMSPIIEKFIKSEQKGSGVDFKLDEETVKRHLNAFKTFNKLYKDTTEQEIGVDITKKDMDGKIFVFSAKNANLFLDKEYNINLYIDPNKVKKGYQINLSVEKEIVKITPKVIILSKKNFSSDIIKKKINIVPLKEGMGVLKAAGKGENSECLIDIKKKEIKVPENGIEFEKKNFTAPPNVHNVLRILINTHQIKFGEKILVDLKEDSIKLDKTEIEFSKENLITEDIGEIIIGFKGSKEVKAECSASCGAFKDTAKISISYGHPDSGDIFRGWHFIKEDQDFQSYYNPLNGYIEINIKNSINKKIFAEEVEDAYKKLQFSSYAKVFLAQLIIEEAFNKIGSDAYEKGKIKGKDKFTALLNFKNKKKNEEGLNILNDFVSSEDLEGGIIVLTE